MDPPVGVATAEESSAVDGVENPDALGVAYLSVPLTEDRIIRAQVPECLAKQTFNREISLGHRRPIRLGRDHDTSLEVPQSQSSGLVCDFERDLKVFQASHRGER